LLEEKEAYAQHKKAWAMQKAALETAKALAESEVVALQAIIADTDTHSIVQSHAIELQALRDDRNLLRVERDDLQDERDIFRKECDALQKRLDDRKRDVDRAAHWERLIGCMRDKILQTLPENIDLEKLGDCFHESHSGFRVYLHGYDLDEEHGHALEWVRTFSYAYEEIMQGVSFDSAAYVHYFDAVEEGQFEKDPLDDYTLTDAVGYLARGEGFHMPILVCTVDMVCDRRNPTAGELAFAFQAMAFLIPLVSAKVA
jgi:hypothetical protein